MYNRRKILANCGTSGDWPLCASEPDLGMWCEGGGLGRRVVVVMMVVVVWLRGALNAGRLLGYARALEAVRLRSRSWVRPVICLIA